MVFVAALHSTDANSREYRVLRTPHHVLSSNSPEFVYGFPVRGS